MNRARKIFALLLAALLFALPLTSCSDNAKKPVATCAGHEILYEEVRFLAHAYLKDHPDASAEEVRTETEKGLFRTYALFALAADYGCETGDKLTAAVNDALKAAISELGGKSAYKSYLKENGMTEHQFRHLLAQAQLEIELGKKLDSRLADNGSLLDWLDEGNYVRVRRILIPASNENLAERSAKAEQIRRELIDGASADALFKAEDAAAGMVCRSPEYMFRGLSDQPAQEEAALALTRTGEVSPVLETAEGFVIFLRVSNERQTLIDYQLSALLERYRNLELTRRVTERAATMTVEWNEDSAELDWTNLK